MVFTVVLIMYVDDGWVCGGCVWKQHKFVDVGWVIVVMVMIVMVG